jgi:hypothetical protein
LPPAVTLFVSPASEVAAPPVPLGAAAPLAPAKPPVVLTAPVPCLRDDESLFPHPAPANQTSTSSPPNPLEFFIAQLQPVPSGHGHAVVLPQVQLPSEHTQ